MKNLWCACSRSTTPAAADLDHLLGWSTEEGLNADIAIRGVELDDNLRMFEGGLTGSIVIVISPTPRGSGPQGKSSHYYQGR
jgi:hypothetical protein